MGFDKLINNYISTIIFKLSYDNLNIIVDKGFIEFFDLMVSLYILIRLVNGIIN